MISDHHLRDTSSNHRTSILICLILAIITLSVYWQVHTFNFIRFDDDQYVYNNPHVKNGLTMDDVIWAFTSFHSSNWHPLTWISHMIDCQVFGIKPGRHHVINLLFHIFNTLLLFLVFKKMTGKMWRSAFVAALFALHPLHVESVAWISERKDVLSTFFFLLMMFAYLKYARRPTVIRYLFVFLFLALGLMSKPMLVTAPFVLLLMDLWPLNRIQFNHSGGPENFRTRATVFRLILEKLPLFFLSALSCIVTYHAQKIGESIAPSAVAPILTRVTNSIVSYLMYIEKMIYPLKMGILYPYVFVQPTWKIVVACSLLIFISLLSLLMIKKTPYFIVGWLWFLGTLIPVIGLVQVGYQSMADRYTYIPLIGLFIIITWGGADALKGWKQGKIWLALSASLILIGLTLITWKQVGYWKNSITLFKHTLRVTSGNYVIHNNLGLELDQKGHPEEAINNYLQAIRIMPSYVNPYYNIGLIKAREGHKKAAIRYYLKAIRINPKLEEAYRNLGDILYNQGHVDAAIRCYLQAIKINPNLAQSHEKLGNMLYTQGYLEAAITQYLQAVKIKPNLAGVYNNIGNVLYKQGHPEKAVYYYSQAIKINPNLEKAYNNLGNALYKQGLIKEAIKEYMHALKIKPDFVEAYNSLGVAFIQAGNIDNAIACFKKALQIDPDFNSAKTNLEVLIKQEKKQ